MATSGQTLNDRINAARYAIAGQGLARCVCKATTEEVIGPKKKHLDYLLACTHEPNVSIPQMANLLIERTNHIYWVVVFKALVTVHHLMSYGNERFTQYLASSGYSFELSTFLDKTAARDFSMSTFIRRYSRYINEKALSYRLLAFDFCKVKRGNEGVLRLMPIDRLLKTLPILQNQLDALLEFDCSANDLNNGVINACFMLLFRDLIGLFACHNDGIINLLNKYFTLNRKMCREAFDLYKKFLVRMDKVSDFLRVAEVVGIDKDEIPDLKRAPSSLIEALEQHLQNIESNKKILKQQQSLSTLNNKSSTSVDGFSALGNLTPPTSRRPNSPGNLTGVAAILHNNNTNTSTSTATSTNNTTNNSSSQSDSEFSINSFKDEEVRKALEEEARVLSQYGTFDAKPIGGGPGKVLHSKNKNNCETSPKFAVSTIPKSIDDIFGDSDSFGTTNSTATNDTKISGSGNNFATMNNGDGSASNAFDDNFSGGSSSSAKSRPNMDSIKSAIKMATTTLESGKASGSTTTLDNSKPSNKKASEDLFSLLDTSALGATTGVNQQQSNTNNPQTTTATNSSILNDPISPFATTTTTPFSIPAPISNINSQQQQQHSLKKGNPFPEVVAGNHDTFATNSASSGSAAGFPGFPSATPLAPMFRTSSNNNNSSINSVFNSKLSSTTGTKIENTTSNNNTSKQSNQMTTTANYTNLGGLEGFGDLLQPMNSSSSSHNNKPNYNINSNSTALGTTNLKSAFNSANSGSSSTGLFKGDLDSTLANLAQNLTFDGLKSGTKK